MPDEEKIGYCPYCLDTLRTYQEAKKDAVQVVCRCRNVDIPHAEMRSLGLRAAWEKAVEWRG